MSRSATASDDAPDQSMADGRLLTLTHGCGVNTRELYCSTRRQKIELSPKLEVECLWRVLVGEFHLLGRQENKDESLKYEVTLELCLT